MHTHLRIPISKIFFFFCLKTQPVYLRNKAWGLSLHSCFQVVCAFCCYTKMPSAEPSAKPESSSGSLLGRLRVPSRGQQHAGWRLPAASHVVRALARWAWSLFLLQTRQCQGEGPTFMTSATLVTPQRLYLQAASRHGFGGDVSSTYTVLRVHLNHCRLPWEQALGSGRELSRKALAWHTNRACAQPRQH